MPTPGPLRRRRPPAPSGSPVQQPPRSGRSPALQRRPAAPRSPLRAAAGSTPGVSGGLESSFSVEAILARPNRCAPAASCLSVAACTAQGLWTAPSRSPVLPWACPAAWLPTYLGVGLYPLCPQSPVLGLRVAHLCGLSGLLDVTDSPQGRLSSRNDDPAFLGRSGCSARSPPLQPVGMQGFSGLELAHHPGLWSPPDWVPAKDLPDTERCHKRVRTVFSFEQLEELEKVFAKQHNLVGKKRAQLAAQLNLTENQVRVWFQNRRVKYQKQQKLKLLAPSAVVTFPTQPSSRSHTSIKSEDIKSGVGS